MNCKYDRDDVLSKIGMLDIYNPNAKQVLRSGIKDIVDTTSSIPITEIPILSQNIKEGLQMMGILADDGNLEQEITSWFQYKQGQHIPENNKDNSTEQLTEQQFDQEEQRRENHKEDFLRDEYGSSASAKNKGEQFGNQVIRHSFIFKTDENNKEIGIIQNDTDVNNEIHKQQEKLYNNIITYIESKPENQNKQVFDIRHLYENEEYTGAYNYDFSIITHQYLSKTSDELNNLVIDSNRNDEVGEQARNTLNAYNSLTVLRNFDNFIRLRFGNAVNIDSDNYPKFTSENKYSIGKQGSNVYTTWRTSEEIWLNKEVNNIVQTIVNTTPMYAYGSNVPLEGQYLKFNSFNYIVGKIKDLVYNPITFSENATFNAERMRRLNNFFSTNQDLIPLVSGRSLGSIISRIRLNPQIYSNVIFRLLGDSQVYSDLSSSLSNFSIFDKNLVYTAYKGLFGADDSLYGINKQSGFNKTNYYAYLTQVVDSIFNSKYIQYYTDENKNIYARNMSDQTIDQVSRNIESNISIANSRNIIKWDKQNIDEGESLGLKQIYNFTENVDSNNLLNIKFKIPNTNFTVNTFADGTTKLFRADSTENILTNSIMTKQDWDLLVPFFKNVLKLDFNNKNLFDAFASIRTITLDSGNIIQYNDMSKDLVKFSSNVLFNMYVANEKLKDLNGNPLTDSTSINKILYSIYTQDRFRPTFNKRTGELNLTTTYNTPIIKDISMAKAYADNLLTSSQVKDGNGNAVSAASLSRLLGSFKSQWQLQNINNNSASKNFQLFGNGVLKQIYQAKEMKDAFSSTSKSHMDFNAAEMSTTAFLYDWEMGLYEQQGRGTNYSLTGAGKIAIVPSVNSDKPNIGRLLIDTNQIKDKNGISLYEHIKNNNIQGIYDLIKDDLGNFYRTSLNNINNDYGIKNSLGEYPEGTLNAALQEYMLQDNEGNIINNVVTGLPLHPTISNYSKESFDEFNTLCASIGKVPTDVIDDATAQYNNKHPNNIIKIIDQVHYVNKKGQLTVNTTLMALLDRFSDNPTIPENQNFWKSQNLHLLSNLLKDNFSIITDENSPQLAIKELTNRSKNWIDSSTNQLILGKFTINNKTINIVTPTDLLKVAKVLNIQETLKNLITLSPFQEAINNNSLQVQLNPELESYNAVNYLIGSEWLASTVGSHYAHPSKDKTGTIIGDEASRFNAQDKRNVSFTAAMHSFQLQSLNGIPSDYNVGILNAFTDELFNVVGDVPDNIEPHDGATFVNPFIVYLENNSLAGAKVGINKKQFVHYYDEKTGTGGIIKTAGFGLTNDLIRNSRFYQAMMEIMTDRQWRDSEGNLLKGNILSPENHPIEFINKDSVDGRIYYKEGNNWWLINTNTLQYNPTTNLYTVQEQQVDNQGNELMDADNNIITRDKVSAINSNYSLWKFLGGENSMSMNSRRNKLVYSESSIQNVVDAMNEIGIDNGNIVSIKNGNYMTQEQVYQPLKHSDIHYIPNAGAVKQGGANFNKIDTLKLATQMPTKEQTLKLVNPLNYNFNYYKIHMYQAGIQLNKEHGADGDEVSLMTQVISGCAARGYTESKANELYQALASLAQQSVKNQQDALNQYIINPEGNKEKFQQTVSKVIVDALINQSDSGDFASMIAQDLISKVKEGKELKLQDYNGVFPYSDGALFNKLVSIINVELTSKAIKIKIPGILSVLCPSYDIMKLYGNKKLDYYNTDEQLQEEQNKYNNDPEFVTYSKQEGYNHNISNMQLSRTYNIQVTPGMESSIQLKSGTINENGIINMLVNSPRDYKWIKNNLNSFDKITEDITVGRNLGHYNINFSGDDNKSYQLYDLASIDALFDVKERNDLKQDNIARNQFNNEVLNKIITDDKDKQDLIQMTGNQTLSYNNIVIYLRRQLQRDLLNIHNNKNVIVSDIDGYKTVENPKIIKEQAYEVVMPRIYKSLYGLEQDDNLSDIEEQKEQFFLNKIQEKYDSRIDDPIYYDLELKKLNGNHIYLMKMNRRSQVEDGYLFKQKLINKINEDDKYYRIDNEGNIMYEMNPDDKVYEYATNQGTQEVILTDDFNKYINQSKFINYHFSNSLNDQDLLNLYQEVISRPSEKTSENYNKQAANYRNIIEQNGGSYNVNNLRELNNMNVFESPFLNDLTQQSKEIYSSFRKSLDIVAARIPAQSMQSFMPMKVVAFDNPDINTAYVSTAQIWLQGSDYDVDSVTLTNYSFDRNGKYQIWSPLANLSTYENLRASEQLPFPTGNVIENGKYKNQPIQYNILSNNGLFVERNGNWELNNTNPQNLLNLSKIINFVNKNGLLGVDNKPTIKFSYNGIDITNDIIPVLEESINNHNKYIENSKLGNNYKEGMIKNFFVTKMYDISSDPANLIESQVPLDAATSPLEKVANESPIAKQATTDIPGDFTNKLHAIIENHTGKQGVGICAVGMKSYFAATEYFNRIINTGTPEQQERLKFNVNLKSINVTKHMLSNVFGQNPGKLGTTAEEANTIIQKGTVDNADILRLILSTNNDDDQAIVLSALLSLATDNAKKLSLSKLNAGTNMLGMYIYGISLGIDFRDISNIINSDAGILINNLMQGNMYNEERPMSMGSVFDYFDIGPNLNKYDSYDDNLKDTPLLYIYPKLLHSPIAKSLKYFDYYGKIRSLDQVVNKVPFSSVIRDIAHSDMNINDKLNYLEKLKEPNKQSVNRLINFCQKYIQDSSVIYSNRAVYDDIKNISQGAEEFRILGSLLHINQGLHTSVTDFLNYLNNFEGCINQRISIINREASRLNYNNGKRGDAEIPKDSIPDNLNIHKFLYDENYRNRAIQLYNQYKHTFNILDIISGLPHYNAYLKVADLANQMLQKTSIKYRTIKRYADSKISEFNIYGAGKQQVYSRLQDMTNDYLRKQWLLNRQESFTIQKGEKYYTGDGQLKTSGGGTQISMGQYDGDATFKLWMEQRVIPDLQQGIINTQKGSQKNMMLINNKFIQSLQYVVYTNTPNRNPITCYSLPINMSPRTAEETQILDEYKQDFNLLKTAEAPSYTVYGKSHNIVDLLFKYMQICFQNRPGENSLKSIFQDSINYSELKDFYNYENQLDENDINIDKYALSDAEVNMWIFPYGSPQSVQSKYFYYRQKGSNQISIYRKATLQDYRNDMATRQEIYEMQGENIDFKDIPSNITNGLIEVSPYDKTNEDIISPFIIDNYHTGFEPNEQIEYTDKGQTKIKQVYREIENYPFTSSDNINYTTKIRYTNNGKLYKVYLKKEGNVRSRSLQFDGEDLPIKYNPITDTTSLDYERMDDYIENKINKCSH